MGGGTRRVREMSEMREYAGDDLSATIILTRSRRSGGQGGHDNSAENSFQVNAHRSVTRTPQHRPTPNRAATHNRDRPKKKNPTSVVFKNPMTNPSVTRGAGDRLMEIGAQPNLSHTSVVDTFVNGRRRSWEKRSRRSPVLELSLSRARFVGQTGRVEQCNQVVDGKYES
jgi:hypothetical protein